MLPARDDETQLGVYCAQQRLSFNNNLLSRIIKLTPISLEHSLAEK
jgi:hypothetical protein